MEFVLTANEEDFILSVALQVSITVYNLVFWFLIRESYYDESAASVRYLHTVAAQLSPAAAAAARRLPAHCTHHPPELNCAWQQLSTPGCLSSPSERIDDNTHF